MPLRTPVDLDKVAKAFRTKREFESILPRHGLLGEGIPSLRVAIKEVVEADTLAEYAGMRIMDFLNHPNACLKSQPLLGYEERDLKAAYDELAKAREALGNAAYKLTRILTGEQ